MDVLFGAGHHRATSGTSGMCWTSEIEKKSPEPEFDGGFFFQL